MKSTIEEIFLENIQSDGNTGITFIDGLNSETHLSYKKLYLEACFKLHSLKEQGLKPGDELIFQFESNHNFVITFWACVFGKIIPVPVAFAAGDNTVQRLSGIWNRLKSPFLITDNEILLENFKDFVKQDIVFEEILSKSIVYGNLQNSKKAKPTPSDPSDIVFIQFSSGSTGQPKGVTNTQEAILYNFQDYLANIQINPEDRFLGWVPLIHDMGLIFFHIIPLLSNVPQFLMPPTVFLTYPELWLENISKHRITISGSPNFGYKLILNNLNRIDSEKLDLSNVRLLINSAEPVSISDCKNFSNALAPAGLSKNCVRAAYGLAEAVLGVSMNYKDEPESKEYVLDRSQLSVGDEIHLLHDNSKNATRFANLGTFDFTEISIVDEKNQVLPDRKLGFVRLRSKAITKGYYNDKENTDKSISADGWLNTGDIGFVDNKQLILTGRAKEMMIINGQNFFPNDVDYLLSEMTEIKFQQAVSCNIFNEEIHRDEIFIFVLFGDAMQEFKVLADKIKKHINKNLGINVSKVIPVGQIPKTTSGKIQRYVLRDRYLNGHYNQVLEELEVAGQEKSTEVFIAPTTDIERGLAKIWEEYFSVDRVGVEANFHFMGGNSIGMGRLATKIEQEFDISLDLRKLFTCINFEDQVKLIEESKKDPIVQEIQAVNESSYNLYTTQRRLFALCQSNNDSLAYNIPVVLKIDGSFDLNKCEDAFKEIINRHEVLRTSFDYSNEKPVQHIHDNVDFCIEIIEDGDTTKLLHKHLKSFDLSSPPLIRVLLCKDKNEFTKLIIDVHHLVADGASFEIIIQELNQLYAGETLEPLELQYKDFIKWNEKKRDGLNLDVQREFWMNQFGDSIEPLKLPIDTVTEATGEMDGDSVIFKLSTEDEKQLRAYCKKERVSMSNMTLAIFYVLLTKLSNTEDIVVGTSTLGRWKKEFDQLIGLFIDTIALRARPVGSLKFSEFLQNVKENIFESMANGDYSFEDLHGDLKLAKSVNSNFLFNIAFEYYNFNWENVESRDHRLAIDSKQVNVVSKFPLVLRIIEREQGCLFYLDYKLDLFKRATAERFAKYYTEIVKSVVKENSIQLKDINILSDAEVSEQLSVFNNEILERTDKNVLELFSSIVKSTPNKTALECEHDSLTYKELNDRANQLARYIEKRCAPNSKIIGVCLDNSIFNLVSILGVLKSGKAYVKIDSSNTSDKNTHILEDAQIELVITDSTYFDEHGSIETIQMDVENDSISLESIHEITSHVKADDLAYINYKTNSAEETRGVRITHKNVVNLINTNSELSLTASDKVLLYPSISFDGSYSDIWSSLLSGATLSVIEKKSLSDMNSLVTKLKQNHINVACFSTVIFNEIVDTAIDALLPLRIVIFGGAKASLNHVQKAYDILGPNKLVNCYGLAENTLYTTCYPINERPFQTVSIGKPVDNTKVYVLDSYNNLCGVGITGELHVSGKSFSNGYLGDRNNTVSQIITNPFEQDTRLLKTGDLVKWLPDGNLEYVGRVDQKVRVNDVSINLAEIESQLNFLDEVNDCLLTVAEIADKQHIIAYYKSKDLLKDVMLKEYLSEYFPKHMIPTVFIQVKEWPLTSNGKVDRQLLQKPTEINDQDFLEPISETEHKLLAIWAEVLQLNPEEISVGGNFFEYGGYSLNVLFLISRINKEFEIKITPSDIMANPTIRELDQLISSSSNFDHVSIPVTEERTHYPLSSSQKRMYYTYEFDKDSVGYNVPLIVTLTGILEEEKLKVALKNLAQRHESLRTTFEFHEGELKQRILPKVEFDLQVLSKEEELLSSLKSFVKPFNLNESPIFRVGINHISTTEHVLIIDTHHIISDGVTSSIFLKELISLYNGENLPELRIQYKDYAVWEQGEIHQSEVAEHKEYWLERFSDEITTLELPYDYPRTTEFDVLGKNHTIELDGAYAKKLKSITQSEEVTMYTLILAVYNLLLYKLSNQNDIVIGTSVAGRSHFDLESIAGVFINTLALRNFVDGQITFKEFLHQIKDRSTEDLAHQLCPYDDLVNALNIEKEAGRSALFDVFLAYQSINNDSTISDSNLQVQLYEDLFPSAQFDLILTVLNFEDKLKFNFTYRGELFQEETITRFMSYLKSIIDQIVIDNSVLIDDIDILPQIELDQQLGRFNDTKLPYDKQDSLVSIFERNVALHPDRIAVSFEGESLSYKELDDRSNQVANYLTSEGVTPNVVGLLIDRSIDMIVGMWGALKVGAGYLPLDPSLPEDRIRYMLDQSRATFLLTHERHFEAYSAYLPVQSIDSNQILSQKSDRVSFKAEYADLAYCIFTSGSTGNPKGVMISHGNVINLVLGLKERVYAPYQGQSLRVALLASYAFDASVQQIFGALLQGHSLYITNDETRKDGTKLLSFFNENKIDLSDGTPTHLRLFLDSLEESSRLECLSSWLFAGEVLPKSSVEKFYSILGEDVQLYNFYGPTEACVDSTCYKIEAKEIRKFSNIPIGKPLSNERVYVTDSKGKLLPVGVIGELCIAGDGLAQRYMGDQFLTSEKFSSEWVAHENRVYKTGDMVRWLPDGNLEFHGRKDNQVKIRGYRIELGEIENRLNSHPDINHSVVMVKELEDEKYLVAYYQASDKVEVSNLRTYLSTYLPDYMIPNNFLYVKEFGLTLNGKVDYKALPDFNDLQITSAILAPTNELERKLVEIFAEVLKLDLTQIGSNSNFIELGGHSLKMVYLSNSIKREFSVKLSLKKIIENPTVHKLANLISQSVTSDHAQISKSEPKEYYPMSSAQRRMYVAQAFSKESLSYNVPIAFTLKGPLDKDRLENSFADLINRHESLRTAFVNKDGQLFQRIHSNVDFSIQYLPYQEDLDDLIKKFTKPFDLSKAPLLRVGLVEISEETFLLIIDSHHIISDEVTSNIILKDFSSLYNGEKIPALRVQYKDYVQWQSEPEQQAEVQAHKTYWVEKFSEKNPCLELPYDFERTAKDADKGNNLLVKISASQVEKLKNIALREGLTLYNLYLSMYNILLYKLSNQTDIVIGTPVAGRQHEDLEDMTGVFINMLPIRNKVQAEMDYKEFAHSVQNGSISDLDHQMCPFEDLVNSLNLERDLTRNPLFDVGFNFMKQDMDALKMNGLRVDSYDMKYQQSKFDLNMIVVEREGSNYLLVEYAEQLFKRKTIERFLSNFNTIVDTVCKDTTVKIGDIEFAKEQETQTLNTFNSMNISQTEQKTIVKSFERQVRTTPKAIAIKYGDQTYTYEELNVKVNQLARTLRNEYGIKAGDIVGVVMPKSDGAIVSILSILKAGAAFLPIDNTYPIERINYIIDNSGLSVVITNSECSLGDIKLDTKVIYDTVNFDTESSNIDEFIPSDSLAYVIYTSGSTGKPKGVMIEHASNVNMSTDIIRQLNVNDRDTILWFASIGFDASVYEIMMSLFSGATLVIPEEGVINDTNRFCSLVNETKTSIVTLPPSYLQTLPLEQLSTLRIITTAGESANARKALEVVNSGIRYFNAYGPTECAVCATTYEVFRDDNELKTIPIGKPIANTEIIILDEALNRVPIGSKGTLYISGEGVARGYLNNPKLTQMSFIQLPAEGGRRFYNTGDIGEWSTNGQIIFHGRKDNQIKLRGYRIELGEIESALSSFSYVRNCHVSVQGESLSEKELIAFVVTDEALDKDQIQKDLSNTLPDYMVPKTWISVNEFPLTINGKVDTNALMNFKLESANDYVAPSNEVEKKLTEICSEILSVDEQEIGVLDDFFDHGGNSLIAIQLITNINKNYGIQLELQDVFKLKTIRALSELIDIDLWVNNDEEKNSEYSREVI